MKYRKKPVVIEAMHYTSDEDVVPILEWVGSEGQAAAYDDGELVIFTLEGEMHASLGDYIIKGIEGEFYPCKPDIFEKTYESA